MHCQLEKFLGSILIGVFAVTLASSLLGLIKFNGLVSTHQFLLRLLKLDIIGALDLAMISIVMSFLFVNLFDTADTLLGVASRANLIDGDGKVLNLDKALKADSSSSIFGTFFGCSPVTSYVESSCRCSSFGGRTGLTTLVVGLLFLITTFFSPIAAIVPAYATAGALVYVSILMLSGLERLNWSNTSELIPALIIVVMILYLLNSRWHCIRIYFICCYQIAHW